MKKRASPSMVMIHRARKHFETLVILNGLDGAERLVTPTQFATAAKIAARRPAMAKARPV